MQESNLLSTLDRFKNREATADDINIIREALESGHLEITPSTESKEIRQSGGTNFGESNEIRVTGSVIGTQSISGFTADEVLELIKYKEENEGGKTKNIILAIAGVIVISVAAYFGYLELRKVNQVPIELVAEDYQNDPMEYVLIIQNNSSEQQLLSKFGVVSHATGDSFCLPPTAGMPLSVAMGYVVSFDVFDDETAHKMEPPLTIPPKDFVRFSVTLEPDDCGSWSSEINLFVENPDGIRVQTESQTINSSDS
jgi:hypothetical protein